MPSRYGWVGSASSGRGRVLDVVLQEDRLRLRADEAVIEGKHDGRGPVPQAVEKIRPTWVLTVPSLM